MAGCYGNHWADRIMESQLMAHLNGEAEWEQYCESIDDCHPEDFWDKHEDLLMSDEFDRYYSVFHKYRIRPATAALVIQLIVKRSHLNS